MTRTTASPLWSWLGLVAAVCALAFPFVVLGVALVRSCDVAGDPESLEDWIVELRADDQDRIEAAVEELATRGRADPSQVVPALIDAMRAEMQDKYLALGLRKIEHPVRLLVIVEEHDPADPQHVLISVPTGMGAGGGDTLAGLVPRLPIGMWVFGSSIETFTLPTGPLAKEFQVQKEVQDEFLAFTTRYRGHRLAFVRGADVEATFLIQEPVADAVRLTAPSDDPIAVASLRRAASLPTLSFHDGYTEAGRALALVGEVVIEPLEALAQESHVAARAAAWARWRLDENLRETGAK